MRQPALEITEILVIGHQDPLLAVGDGQHFVIREPGWKVTPNPGCVATVVGGKGGDPGLDVLIEEKSHTGVSWRSVAAFSRTATVAYRGAAFTSSTESSG